MHEIGSATVRIPSDECPFRAYVMDGNRDDVETGMPLFLDMSKEDAVNAEWLMFRTEGIGGSDVAGILGMSKWSTPLKVWMEKTGRSVADDLSNNASVEWGNRLEDSIREKFADDHPELEVSKFNASLVSKERPWAHANLDGRVRDKDGRWGILECKTASSSVSKEWRDGVPQYYLTQVTHYMSVTGWDYAYVAVLIGGSDYREFRIDRDEGDIEAISDAVDTFWHDYVEADVMPEVVPDDSSRLATVYDSPDGERDMTGDPSFNDLCSEYEQACEEIAEATRRKKELGVRIRDIIGNHKSAGSDVYRITWRRNNKSVFDRKRFDKEHPGLYDSYTSKRLSDGGLFVKTL